MDPVRVVVTEELIAIGRPDDAMWCPVALALKEADRRRPAVYGDTASWTQDGVRVWAPIPLDVAGWIDRFDEGEPVGPLGFELRPEYDPFHADEGDDDLDTEDDRDD